MYKVVANIKYLALAQFDQQFFSRKHIKNFHFLRKNNRLVKSHSRGLFKLVPMHVYVIHVDPSIKETNQF